LPHALLGPGGGRGGALDGGDAVGPALAEKSGGTAESMITERKQPISCFISTKSEILC
jgi:hypothetical protein